MPWSLAQDAVHVAVASNFSAPMKAIVKHWQKQSNGIVSLSFGASGKFYAQIKQGAPFDIFLSADTEKPSRLINEGLAVKDSQFTYGTGALVLWSADPALINNKEPDWTTLQFRRLAVANPRTAPYGRAAMDYLSARQVTGQLTGKIVTGENIAQTFAFIKTGNAQLGFIARSQLQQPAPDAQGSFWLVPEQLHSAIKQDAVLLTRATDNNAALAFYHFLQSPEVASIIQTFGYQIPQAP